MSLLDHYRMDEGIGDSLRDYLASVGGQTTPSLIYKKTDKYFLFCLIIQVKREVGCSDEASFYGSQKRALVGLLLEAGGRGGSRRRPTGEGQQGPVPL